MDVESKDNGITEIRNWKKPTPQEINWVILKLKPMAELLPLGSPETPDAWKSYSRGFLRIVHRLDERRDPTARGDIVYPPVSLNDAANALIDEAVTVCNRFPSLKTLRKVWINELHWAPADGRDIGEVEDEYGDR